MPEVTSYFAVEVLHVKAHVLLFTCMSIDSPKSQLSIEVQVTQLKEGAIKATEPQAIKKNLSQVNAEENYPVLSSKYIRHRHLDWKW